MSAGETAGVRRQRGRWVLDFSSGNVTARPECVVVGGRPGTLRVELHDQIDLGGGFIIAVGSVIHAPESKVVFEPATPTPGGKL